MSPGPRKRIPHSLPSALLGATVLLATASCAARPLAERGRDVGPGWPAADPRVRLERTIELDSFDGGGRSRLRAWLGRPVTNPADFVRPYAVAWEGDALLLVDPDAGSVARIDSRGRLEVGPRGALVSPVAVAVCPAGILVSDSGSGRLALLGEDLAVRRWIAENLERPTGIACVDDRILLVETGRHRLLLLGDEGLRRSIGRRGSGPGEFNYPTCLALDGENVLVGDSLNFRVQRIDLASGEARSSFGRLGSAAGEMPRLKGLAVDRAGHVWVSDAVLDRVSLFDREGRLLLSLGGTGGAGGEFSFPTGIAAHPDGRVAVVDSLNRRLQIFRVLGHDSPAGG